MLVHDDPASSPPLQDQRPTSVEMGLCALFADDVSAPCERDPAQISLPMNSHVIVQFEFDAAVWLKK